MKYKLKILIILTILFVLILLTILVNKTMTGKSVVDFYTYTKAICNEKTCQDYYIICNGNELIEKSPITGSSITNKNYSPQTDQKENFCKN
jgi:hypothetical protein